MSLLEKMKDSWYMATLFAALVCFIVGKAGMMLSEGAGFAVLIWPPAGFAIVLLLYFGYKIWPGIYLGLVLSTINNFGEMFGEPGLMIHHLHYFIFAIGATLQALTAVYAVKRLDLYRHDFSVPAKIGLFYLIIGPVSSVVSATFAIVTLYIMEINTLNSLAQEWLLWWISDGSSAIIFTTLLFACIKFASKRRNIILIFMGVGLSLAFLLSFIGKGWEEERLDLIFQQKVEAAIDSLNQFTSAHISLAENLEGFKSYRPEMTKQELADFANRNLAQNDKVRSLSWIEIVPHSDRQAYEDNLRRIHNDEKIILWETGSDKTRQPAANSEFYTAVKFVEPYELFHFAVGHVVNADASRNAAMNSAINTRQITMTAPVILISEPVTPSAATIYQAHFNGQELEGFTAMIIRIDNMINSILDNDGDNSFYISLYDKEEGERLTFRSFDPAEIDVSILKSTEIEFQILNRTWIISFYRSDAFIVNNQTSQPRFIGVAGIAFAAMVAVVIVILSGQRLFLEKLVLKRTMELEKANRTKSEFIANMSHDLRTPLNAIIGFSEIMQQEMYGKLGSSKYLEYTNDINQSSEYLLSLINDILDFSAIDANKRVLKKIMLDPTELIEECLRSFKPLIAKRKLQMMISFSRDFPPIIADRRAMKQILINLLSNSIKFTPDGGNITISGKYTPENIYLMVSDTGTGIDADNIEKILAPFTRVENHPHLSQEGTGLGLTIVNALVKLHGGTLEITSKSGRGTKVTVILPRK